MRSLDLWILAASSGGVAALVAALLVTWSARRARRRALHLDAAAAPVAPLADDPYAVDPFADDPLPAIPKRRSQQRKIVTVSPTPARHGVTEQLGVPRVGAGSGVLATPGGSPFSTGGVPPGPADPLQGGKGYVIGHICGHVTPPARHHM